MATVCPANSNGASNFVPWRNINLQAFCAKDGMIEGLLALYPLSP